MREMPDLEEILSHNPQIDRKHIEDVRETLRRLRERGVHRKDYDLSVPGGGRRATTRSDARASPRLLKSRRPEEEG